MEDFRSKNEKFYENDNYYNHFRTLLVLEDIEEKLKFFITDIFSKDNILSFKIRFLENIENILIYNNQDKMIEFFCFFFIIFLKIFYKKKKCRKNILLCYIKFDLLTKIYLRFFQIEMEILKNIFWNLIMKN